MLTATLDAPRTKKAGFKNLCCPECGERAEMAVNVATLKVTCPECDAEFTARQAVEKMAERVAEWNRLAEWIEMA